MKVKVKNLSVFGKTRLAICCPSCNDKITLDKETFERDPKYITCYNCDTKYFVVLKDTQKKKKKIQSLDLMKDKNNERKTG